MKKILLVALMLSFSCLIQAEQASTESIKRLLHVTGKIQTHQAMLSEFILPRLQRNMPKAPSEFVETALYHEFENGFITALIPEYQKQFTQAEINAYIDFFTTPVGKKFLAKEPGLNVFTDVQSNLWLQQVSKNIYLKYQQQYGKGQ